LLAQINLRKLVENMLKAIIYLAAHTRTQMDWYPSNPPRAMLNKSCGGFIR